MIRTHIRIGHGHDAHRFAAGARLAPGGVAVQSGHAPCGVRASS